VTGRLVLKGIIMLAFFTSLVLALAVGQSVPPPGGQTTPPPPTAPTTAPPTTAPTTGAQTTAPPPGGQTPPASGQTATPPSGEQTTPPPAGQTTPPPKPQPAVSTARRLAEPEKAGPIVLPLELVAGRAVVRLMVNGKGPYAFLVSTGAPVTVIDEKLAVELALKPPVPEKPKPGEKPVEPPKEKAREQDKRAAAMLELDLEAGTTKLTKVAVLPTDITKYVADAGLAGRSRGVLSLAAWKDHVITLSFPPRSKLTIEPGTLPEPNGEDIFPLDPETGELRSTVTIADQAIPCRVEPLAPGGLTMPETFLKQLLLDGPPIELGTTTVAGQQLVVREARLAYSATLANFELPNPVVRFVGAGDSATAGSQALVGLSITYDLANNRARIARQPPPTPR
jgi:hypothetical protein